MSKISQVDALTLELADAQATIARLERELASEELTTAALRRALDAAQIVRGADPLPQAVVMRD